VWKTNRVVYEPEDLYQRYDVHGPAIVAMWHGQHFLMPFVRRETDRVKVLISRHRDGEVNAIAARRLGVETIRGSGDHGRDYLRKGAVSGFKAMLQALAGGYNVALTADVPKVARVAGLGIVKLGQLSGKPIWPVAIATSRRIELDNWDRSSLNLPFGHSAVVLGSPVRVTVDADEAELEAARRAVQSGLDSATARAYELVDRGRGDAA
jgi:lysophospholipid acyltransferase (LPLAT)-like uncharacterized protein